MISVTSVGSRVTLPVNVAVTPTVVVEVVVEVAVDVVDSGRGALVAAVMVNICQKLAIYCRVPPAKGLRKFVGVRTV